MLRKFRIFFCRKPSAKPLVAQNPSLRQRSDDNDSRRNFASSPQQNIICVSDSIVNRIHLSIPVAECLFSALLFIAVAQIGISISFH